MNRLKKVIATEEAAQFLFSLYMLKLLQIPFHGWFILVFFLPDLFAVGYFAGPTTGAVLYNIAHHKGLAIALIVAGLLWKLDSCVITGLLFYSHSSFDRMLGYGLKLPDSPNHTHLGYIGKEKYKNKF